MSGWAQIGGQPPESAVVDGVTLARGSRVTLRPRAAADIMDLALTGRLAIVESLEEDVGGAVLVAVTLADDPGRDLGEARLPGHRFFFGLDEVQPADAGLPLPAPRRVLVAGIGNVFLGDDGFGVEVVQALARRPLPAGVEAVDFGIRGMDLAYALGRCDAVVFVDAAPRGREPGALYVIEPEVDVAEVAPETHAMDPVRVLAVARAMGDLPRRVVVVGCEPLLRMGGDEEDLVVELSAPVRAAVEPAVAAIEGLLVELLGAEAREEEER